MPEPKDTQFTSATARDMGIKSGIARRPIDRDRDAKKAYNYAVKLLDIIAANVFAPKACKTCKRPTIDDRTLATLTGQLLSLIDMVQTRAWGKPATASRFGSSNTLDDYKRVRREVKNAPAPADLPAPPSEDTQDQSPSDTQPMLEETEAFLDLPIES